MVNFKKKKNWIKKEDISSTTPFSRDDAGPAFDFEIECARDDSESQTNDDYQRRRGFSLSSSQHVVLFCEAHRYLVIDDSVIITMLLPTDPRLITGNTTAAITQKPIMAVNTETVIGMTTVTNVAVLAAVIVTGLIMTIIPPEKVAEIAIGLVIGGGEFFELGNYFKYT